MPTNQIRKELLERIKVSNFPGSIIDVFRAADQGIDLISQFEQQQQQEQIQQQQQDMQVANTPEEQEIGLREQHAMGNTDASMAFPNVQPGQSFNTVGMKAPIDIQKVNKLGHLVESYKNVPPGIQDLPTGPYEGTIIESPAAYQRGGVKKEIGDTIIYPPGDSQYKLRPYNKEILDIRPKLKRMGLYNVENEDLQKAWEWEQNEKKLRKIRSQNRPRSVQTGGFRRYQNGGVTFGGSNLKYDPLNKNFLTSVNTNLTRGNLDIGGEYSGIHNLKSDSSGVYPPSKHFIGGTGRLNFGTYTGTHKGDWENRFMGSLSGKLGYSQIGSKKRGTLSNQGLAASGRLDLGFGRPGKTFCIGNACSAAPVPPRGLGVFGQYGNKYSINPGLQVGGSGHFGNINVEGGYNVTNKSPFINAGLQIPIK